MAFLTSLNSSHVISATPSALPVDQNFGCDLQYTAMAWIVILKESVIDDLRWFGKKDGRLLLDEAESRLSEDPMAEHAI